MCFQEKYLTTLGIKKQAALAKKMKKPHFLNLIFFDSPRAVRVNIHLHYGVMLPVFMRVRDKIRTFIVFKHNAYVFRS